MNPVIAILILANLFGFGIGMLFYWQQMLSVNPVFWIFIPDCPLYVALAALFYLGWVKNDLLRTITAIGLVKYALWTEFALFYYSGYFLTVPFGWLLVFEHIGMGLQFLVFSRAFDKRWIAVSIGWFLLNDFVDYFFGMHPFLPSSNLRVISALTVASSVVLPFAAYYLGPKIQKIGLVQALQKLVPA